jgi:hypothetical protein
MANKLKTYSFTLDEYSVESLKSDLQNQTLPKGFTSVSQYLNYLIKQDLDKRNSGLETSGNLSKWMKKYPKSNPQKPMRNRTNKELMEIYDDKFRR